MESKGIDQIVKDLQEQGFRIELIIDREHIPTVEQIYLATYIKEQDVKEYIKGYIRSIYYEI